MSNDLQTNLEYFMTINYDSFSLCHLTDIGHFFRASERVNYEEDDTPMLLDFIMQYDGDKRGQICIRHSFIGGGGSILYRFQCL